MEQESLQVVGHILDLMRLQVFQVKQLPLDRLVLLVAIPISTLVRAIVAYRP